MSKVVNKGQSKRSVVYSTESKAVSSQLPIKDKATKRILAPYVRIVRKGVKPVEIEEAKQFAEHLQKKPTVLIRDLSSFLSDSVDLRSLLHETADVLQIVTKAAGVTLYMMDSSTHEILVSRKVSVDERFQIRWKIQEGATVASYVAYKKEYVLVDDIIRDDRFPEGIGYEGETAKSVLCVPVLTPDGECFAVIELYRMLTDPPFSSDDLKIVIIATVWMGAAIHQNSQRLALQRQEQLNDYLLDLIKCYIGETVVMEKLILEIVKLAKITLSAERGSCFVIDRQCEELVADLFDDNGENEDSEFKKTRIRFGKERGIASLVARTGITINVKDAYKDVRFNKEMDQKNGFITRSILCMPIMGTGGILGVLQVVNKKSGGFFTPTDESLFRTFSAYSALALHFTNMNKQLDRTKRLNSILLKLVQIQKVPCVHDFEDLKYNSDIKLPILFNQLDWYMNPEDYSKLPKFCFYILTHILNTIELELDNTVYFILAVRKLCRQNPYHNFEHAFSVFHCMYVILKRNIKLFTHLEIKALLIATLCHDVDHPGVTSTFLGTCNDDLAFLYEDCLLENHKYYVTNLILQECKIFSYLTIDEEKILQKEIRQAILSIESLTYFRNFTRLTDLHESDSFDWNDELHRRYLKGIMMESCDVSGLCKPFLIAKRNIDNFYAECYRQGDLEKMLGLYSLSITERRQQNRIPEDQIMFLKQFVIPCVRLLCLFLPNTDNLYTEAKLMRQTWEDIMAVRGKKCWRQDDTIIQKSYT